MQSERRSNGWLGACAGLVALVGAAASAQPSSGGEQAATSRARVPSSSSAQRQQAKPETPPYARKVREGMEALARGDAAAARAALQEATTLEPNRPDAYYYLGLAHRSAGDWAAAEQSLQAALQRASGEDAARWRLRVLVALADVAERKLRVPSGDLPPETLRVDEAGLEAVRAGWSQVQTQAQGSDEARALAVSQARMQAAVRTLEQDRAYVDVRRRIAQREREQRQRCRRGQRRSRR